MADKYWFKHDYNARNDDKNMELRAEFGAEGYGIFWMLLEKMAETHEGWLDGRLMGGIGMDLGIDKKRIEMVINFCLSINLFHKNEEGFIYNSRMRDHKQMRLYLSESGKRGANKREENKASKPTIKGGLSTPSTEKIRRDINIAFDVFWNLYDYKVGNKEKLNIKWCKLSEIDRQDAIAFIPRYKNSTPDKKFRKQPETFINNRSWTDEIVVHQLKPAKQVNDGRPVN